jgi:hypothetical protein
MPKVFIIPVTVPRRPSKGAIVTTVSKTGKKRSRERVASAKTAVRGEWFVFKPGSISMPWTVLRLEDEESLLGSRVETIAAKGEGKRWHRSMAAGKSLPFRGTLRAEAKAR